MRIELHILESDLGEEAFEKSGGPKPVNPTDYSARGLGTAHLIDPVSQIIIVTSISLIASRLVDHWLKGREQGVKIDLSRDPPLVSRIAGVPAGFVLLIDEKGQKTLEKYDYDQRNDLKEVLAAFFSRKKEG